MYRPAHPVEPELLQPIPRKIRFDGTYTGLSPTNATIGVGLFSASILYLIIKVFPHIPDPSSKMMSIGVLVLMIVTLIGAVVVYLKRAKRLKRLISTGTALVGQVTDVEERRQFNRFGSYMMTDAISYTFEGRVGKDRVGVQSDKVGLSSGREITILYDPELGSVIYQLCCYKAVLPEGSMVLERR